MPCLRPPRRPSDGPNTLEASLRAAPEPMRLFAAVAEDGAVGGTSGCIISVGWTTVIFVDTDPEWQRRGIGAAMTAVALAAARESGAARAILDASDAALSMYRRLGVRGRQSHDPVRGRIRH